MGNQVSGTVPGQIMPLENYVAELNNKIFKKLIFQRSLGSTRFLKVAMCLSDRGPLVIKIFVIPDSSISLKKQKIKAKIIYDKLSSAYNCLTFFSVEITEKAAFIMRQYVKGSLYDRISTRPFLSMIEKIWFAFQLLCALKQCHQYNICHGDIKLENLLVTSWYWLVLSDFAHYKPVLLPEDNPNDFTFYFDTSRRRVCHIAPERFIKGFQKEDDLMSEKEAIEEIILTPQMDIFSAGCVLIELFTEGFYPFSLMQLLQFRSGVYYPSAVLDKISDSTVKSIVESMICKTASNRPSASEILKNERGKLFPESFYAVLWPFCKQFSVTPGMPADERISKVENSMSEILESLNFLSSEKSESDTARNISNLNRVETDIDQDDTLNTSDYNLPPLDPVTLPPLDPVFLPPLADYNLPPLDPVPLPPLEPIFLPPLDPVILPPLDPVPLPSLYPVFSPPLDPVPQFDLSLTENSEKFSLNLGRISDNLVVKNKSLVQESGINITDNVSRQLSVSKPLSTENLQASSEDISESGIFGSESKIVENREKIKENNSNDRLVPCITEKTLEDNSNLTYSCSQISDANKSCLIVITSLVTSCIRALKLPSSKLSSLKIFKTLSCYVSSDIILDRILPYILNLLKDHVITVRSEALSALTYCISRVDYLPRSEINIFMEYIFPSLNETTLDISSIVRQTEAACVAQISDTALRFIEFCRDNFPDFNYEKSVENLQELMQQKLAKLFSDSSNVVKRTLIEETLSSLCLFFGKEKANDVLLSHLITFLNEKKDYHLRLSFYKNVIDIANFMGSSCNPILKPLLLQGLSDTEECVCVRAIDTMSSLTLLKIFPDQCLQELLSDAIPLLIHPNMWIRHAVTGLIMASCSILSFLDVHTIVASIIKPFLVKPIVQYDKPASVLSSLKPPISRPIYDTIIKYPDVGFLLNELEQFISDRIDMTRLPESYGERNTVLRNVMKKLKALGMNNTKITPILTLRQHLIKVNRHRKVLETLIEESRETKPHGLILLSNGSMHSFLYSYKLLPNDDPVTPSNTLMGSLGSDPNFNVTMNEEWRTMFGGSDGIPGELESYKRSLQTGGTPMESSEGFPSSLVTSFSSQAFALEHSLGELNGDVPGVCKCEKDLEQLLRKKKDDMAMSLQRREPYNSVLTSGICSSSKWRPKGQLVSHLHEHRGGITRLLPLGDSSIFASASKDGVVKIWDANKIERTFPVNRSKFTYNQQKGFITSITDCWTHNAVASASDNGTIHVFKIDKQTLMTSRTLDKETDGYATDINYLEGGSSSLLTYSTVYGRVVAWDLRSPDVAWSIDNGVKKGVITSYVIDANNNWLACGTSNGIIVCWDLRFMLPVSEIFHEHNHSIQRLRIHPTMSSSVIASYRTNNEVAIWDMETQSRSKTLWASTSPPFSEKPSRISGYGGVDNWVHGIVGIRNPGGQVSLVTVGTDSRIRYWDLNSPENSYLISNPALPTATQSKPSYTSRVIESSEVIIEKLVQSTSPTDDYARRYGDQAPTGHVETISDVIAVTQPQKLLITSGFDGTIKMWK